MVLERLREASKDPRPLLEAVGLYLVSQSQGAFRQQGRGSVSWEGRGTPNRIGVLLDLQAGRVPPARRFQARPAAIDTGRLRQSIAYRVSGNTVTVGSSLPYASEVQRGSTKTITLDTGLRRALSDWLRSLSGSQKTAMRKSFGFLFHTGSLTVTTPPRPFVLLTAQDRQWINDAARRFFLGGYQK